MSIWKELFETERIVRRADRADAAFSLTSDLSSGYRAARDSENEFVAQRRSNIRERALGLTLERVRLDDLQERRSFGELALSPGFDPRRGAFEVRRGARERLLQQIAAVRVQDAAADADERAYARASPLQQARLRDGWYRVSDFDRSAAIAGLLRRERRTRSPLTREAASRAKSIDAARGILDSYVVTDADLERASVGPLTSLEYADYVNREKRRRETLFAKGAVVGGGYPGVRAVGYSKMKKEVSCGPY